MENIKDKVCQYRVPLPKWAENDVRLLMNLEEYSVNVIWNSIFYLFTDIIYDQY